MNIIVQMPIEWNKRQDDRLNKFEKLIRIEMELNKRASNFYDGRSQILNFPSIILGSVVTSSIFIDPGDKDYMRYVNGALTLITTILASLKVFLKYENKMNIHKNAELAYTKLVLDIENQKDLEYKDREGVVEFMKNIKDRYINLKESSSTIPAHIEKQLNEGMDKFILSLKTTGELSESSEVENNVQKRVVKVLNEETGEHELTTIFVEIPEDSDAEENETKYRMKNIEKQIDSLTNSDLCNKRI